MEFAGIHHKLHKQGLFNLNVKWLHFQKRSVPSLFLPLLPSPPSLPLPLEVGPLKSG